MYFHQPEIGPIPIELIASTTTNSSTTMLIIAPVWPKKRFATMRPWLSP